LHLIEKVVAVIQCARSSASGLVGNVIKINSMCRDGEKWLQSRDKLLLEGAPIGCVGAGAEK
jgi:hypothetical protein